jgi:SAM-dependent methyltransferase
MTAYTYWDQVWRTDEGRADWAVPDPWVVSSVAWLRARGVREVVDVGCGTGRHALYLAEQGFTVRALDRSESAVSFVRAEAQRRGLPVTADIADFTRLPFPAAHADLVLAFNVVYHNDEAGLRRVLAETARVLRPGGVYQCTMLSKRNRQHGLGEEISPNTFVQPRARDDKVHPHLYVDAADLVRLHTGFELESAFDVEHTEPGSYHWHCRFEAGATPIPGDGDSS